jgi:hypothetical protein
MQFFWRHKILSLFIIAGVVYWFANPWHKFGLGRPSVVVFNKVPVMFFDLYIDPEGRQIAFENLRQERNVQTWMEQKIQSLPEDPGTARLLLLVGTGFSPGAAFKLPEAAEGLLFNKGFLIKYLSSPEAMIKYNDLHDMNKPVAILLHILE